MKNSGKIFIPKASGSLYLTGPSESGKSVFLTFF